MGLLVIADPIIRGDGVRPTIAASAWPRAAEDGPAHLQPARKTCSMSASGPNLALNSRLSNFPEPSAHFPAHVHLDQRELLEILRVDLVEVSG